MKILHILDHSIPQHSGYSFRTLSIIREQRRRGWQTAHVTSGKHPDPNTDEFGIEQVDDLAFYRTAISRHPLHKLGPLSQFGIVVDLQKTIQRVIEKEQPSVLHAHSPALNGLAALSVARKYELPLVYEIRAFWEDAAVDHGTAREGDLRYRLTRAMESHVIRRADFVTTICQGLREDIVARGKAENRVVVIPNAVDVERFPLLAGKDTELQAKLGLADSEVVGFIGSFYAYEGLPLLVEAIARLRHERPRLRLLLVGGGPDENNVRQAIDKFQVADKVIMTGRVPHDHVQQYYSLLDALIYPRMSKRITELVTPLKPLESMAQGCLVIASDVQGHRELIVDRENGLLFEAENANSLAGILQEALDNPSLRQRCRNGGRDYVCSERNWARSVANYAPIYEELVRVN